MKKSQVIVFLLAAALLQACCGKVVEQKCAFDCGIAKELGKIVKEAGIPHMQLNYKGPDGQFGFGIQNLYFADTAARAIVAVNGDDSTAIFQGASLSKVIFSYIVMRMYQDGEIDLDKPLCNYTDIDRFTNKEYASLITARIVLSHRTGLSNWAYGPSAPEWPVSPIEFKFRPDSCYGYSGEGIAFLQRAVESIKGKSIDEIAQEMVFDPLGMSHTAYCWLPCYDSLAVPGFNGNGENRGPGRYPRSNTAYTIRTNAKEYGKFLDELFWGESLSAQTRELFFAPGKERAIRYAGEPRQCDSTMYWGMSIGIEMNPKYGKVLWHWGDNGNFKALFMYLPQQQKRFVYFTNSAHGHDIINKVTALLFAAEEPFAMERWINQ